MEKSELVIYTVFAVHQRRYSRAFRFHRKQLGKAWSLLYPPLAELEARSQLEPIASISGVRLARGVVVLAAMPELGKAIRSSPEFLSSALLNLFSLFEQRLIETLQTTSREIGLTSRATRSLVLDAFRARGQHALVARVRKQFVSQLPSGERKGRALISDLPREGRAPLSGIPHSSHAELKSATTSVLREDLERIVKACRDVLHRYTQALNSLNALLVMQISEADSKRVLNKSVWVPVDQTTSIGLGWKERDLDIYLVLMMRNAIALSGKSARMPIPPGLKAHLRSKLYGISNGSAVQHLLKLDVAMPAEVLLACALILQIHTHWNYISILELTVDDLTIQKYPHRLQSVKPRTGDETPPVFVERSDEDVLLAIDYLVQRWRRLVESGRIPETERRLWLSSRSLMTGAALWCVVAWGGELRRFTQSYGLPNFTLEQVRVQCLATVAIGDRGINGVMQAAGHRAVATSLRYVDKLLMQRLNSSNTLEFERRLEKTVLYMMGRDVDTSRLISYPIGDGSSCREPTSPPDSSWIESGVCRAERCHDGDGCPNRRIVISEERLEEAIRTRDYYVANWKRLADENPLRFEKVQLPHMLFSLALYGVLRRGPYRHLLSSYEEKSI